MTGQPTSLKRAGTRVRRLDKRYTEAVAELKELLYSAVIAGMKPSDAARVAGISRQYAHKLLRLAQAEHAARDEITRSGNAA
jgi:hypothetical protein